MKSRFTSLPSNEELVRLASEAGWRVSNLSAKMGISRRQLERRFLITLGVTPHRWIDEQRSEIASQRLMNRDQAKLVAGDLGFASPSHFSRWFKNRNSQTATEFLTKAALQRSSETGRG